MVRACVTERRLFEDPVQRRLTEDSLQANLNHCTPGSGRGNRLDADTRRDFF